MAGKDNFKIVNFRLNLEKKEEKELYDFLQSIDNGNLKNCYGSKSGFIKEILIAHMHGGVGVTDAFTSTSGEELKAVVKEAFLECMDMIGKDAFKVCADTASQEYGGSIPRNNELAISKQTDDIPDDAMDYLKELYG